MLSAIQDFVSDSFTVDDDDALDSLKLGGLTVCIETAPAAVLAMVIRGNPPASLRQQSIETLEQIHQTHRGALDQFEGDAAPFEGTAPLLQSCLLEAHSGAEQKDTAKTPNRSRAIVIVAALLAAIAYWGFSKHSQNTHWQQVLQNVSDEPGYIVTAAGKNDGHYFITGLRDPGARMPSEIPGKPLEIKWTLRPYYSLDHQLVEWRLGNSIEFPQSLKHVLIGSKLILTGRATADWLTSNSPKALSVTGIDNIDVSRVYIEKPEPEPPIAAAISAPEISPAPAIPVFDVQATIEKIESHVFYFNAGDALPDTVSMQQLNELVTQVDDLNRHLRANEQQLVITARGYADGTGPARVNMKISQQRAQTVSSLLNNHLESTTSTREIGLGSDHQSSGDNARRVTLQAEISPTIGVEK